MIQPHYSEAFERLTAPLDSPKFFRQAFTLSCLHNEKESQNPLEILFWEEYALLSKDIAASGLQDPSSVRNVLKARALAFLLILDDGELDQNVLREALNFQKQYLYSLGPEREFDIKKEEHMLSVLNQLEASATLKKALQKITRPWRIARLDEVIRETLALPPGYPITDADAKRAALSALLTTLRQAVGSCFATAPAIVLHDHQMEIFLQDIADIFATGKLKRVVEGKEYAVPFCPTAGSGDLKRAWLYKWNEKKGPWRSPAVLEALDALQIFDKGIGIEEKKQRVKELFRDFYMAKGGEPFVASLEMIFIELIEKTFREKIFLQKGRGGGFVHETKGLLALKRAEATFCRYETNILLRVWEFTLASFSEAKSDVTKWNFFTSLGLQETDEHGIGSVAYQYLKDCLADAQRKLDEMRDHYEMVFSQLKFLEGRLKSASTEQEQKWIKVEYDSKAAEFYTLEDMQNDLKDKANALGQLFSFLIEYIDDALPRFFQEVYDPDIFEGTAAQFEDSPAGFRLMYKHGRENPSLWTFIQGKEEFQDTLAAFFIAIEVDLQGHPFLQNLQREFSEMITRIVQHVRTDLFLKWAIIRMGNARGIPVPKDPLQHLDQLDIKPWSYTSGGTMQTLVQCYFRLKEPVKEVSRWLENPVELVTFAVDTVKSLPAKYQQQFFAKKDASLLMHSPTHAFLLKPGWLEKIIEKDILPYIFLRDRFLFPCARFWEEMEITKEQQKILLERLFADVDKETKKQLIPKCISPYVSLPPKALREFWVDKKIAPPEIIDALLWEYLPMVKQDDFFIKFSKIVKEAKIPQELKDQLECIKGDVPMQLFPSHSWVPGIRLLDAILGLSCLILKTKLPFCLSSEIKDAMRRLGYLPPKPYFFADTNWNHFYFALTVNPGTGQSDLWRFEEGALRGFPMNTWRQRLSGNRKDFWTIYIHPQQYVF